MSREQKNFWLGTGIALVGNFIAFGIFLWVTGGKVATANDKIERTEMRVSALESRVEQQSDLLSRIDERTKSIKEGIERIEHRRNP